MFPIKVYRVAKGGDGHGRIYVHHDVNGILEAINAIDRDGTAAVMWDKAAFSVSQNIDEGCLIIDETARQGRGESDLYVGYGSAKARGNGTYDHRYNWDHEGQIWTRYDFTENEWRRFVSKIGGVVHGD